MPKQALILDCDGVLYPISQISLAEFVDAMKQTYREELKIDGKTQTLISEQTIAKNRLGMFNYIKAMCDYADYNFDEFCLKMQSRVDYDKITPDHGLYNQLLGTAKDKQVVILTNNHITHLDKVLQRRFGKSLFEVEADGIDCYDIKTMERNGVFYPKQNPQALKNFAAKINQLPENCTLVDDTEKNLISAKQAGMKAVLINEKFTLRQYLQQVQNNNLKIKTGKENG